LYLKINKSFSSRKWSFTNSSQPFLKNMVSSSVVSSTCQVPPLGPLRIYIFGQFLFQMITKFFRDRLQFKHRVAIWPAMI
jgi:hypothetical protein